VAQGGTLFIDEIGELPLNLQTRLLRVLENGHIRRVGSHNYREVNVRVIAASNRDLGSMVSKGEFRQDLYYRLSAFPVRIPPLRERRDDIVLLAEHFLRTHADGDVHIPLANDVIVKLMNYTYPGNVRELRNILERAVILAFEDTLRPEHIVLEQLDSNATGPDQATQVAERLVRRKGRLDSGQVLDALKLTHGHRREAADLLGVSERTLYRYIRKMNTDKVLP
jgi:DNA-binding NtrC family response regulator